MDLIACRLMTVSLALMLAAQTYFVYKFVRLFLKASRDRYISTRDTLAFFCVCRRCAERAGLTQSSDRIEPAVADDVPRRAALFRGL